MPIDRYPQNTPNEQSVKTQIRDAHNFCSETNTEANELIKMPKYALELFVKQHSNKSEGVIRRILPGIFRLAEGSGDIVSIYEIYDRLEERQPPEEETYVELITSVFPPPLEFLNDEKIPVERAQPRAFIGHYIDMNGSIDDIIAGIESAEGIYNFGDLCDRLMKFFEGATIWRWDFKRQIGFNVAFRVCFLSYRQQMDSSGDFNGEYVPEESFRFIPFTDNTDALIDALTLLNQDIDIKTSHYHVKEGMKPQIKWILPLFPLMDSDQFLKEYGERTGFYCEYRRNPDETD